MSAQICEPFLKAAEEDVNVSKRMFFMQHGNPKSLCHASESWHPERLLWMPAFAGMTQALLEVAAR